MGRANQGSSGSGLAADPGQECGDGLEPDRWVAGKRRPASVLSFTWVSREEARERRRRRLFDCKGSVTSCLFVENKANKERG